MSADRFDDLTKALATGTSRRRFLKSLGVTAAAGALSVIWSGRAQAQAGCRNDSDCTSTNPCVTGECVKDPATSQGRTGSCVFTTVICRRRNAQCCQTGAHAGECRVQC
jgi:hypothetical protein